MARIKIEEKPLSVNKAWFGKKVKTNDYRVFEQSILYQLPTTYDIPDGELKIYLEFGVSSRNFDIDNGVKPFVDILQKKYGFNDNRIYHSTQKKVIVPKGEEYIEFEITN